MRSSDPGSGAEARFERTYVVFAQRAASVDVEAWNAHAWRFFGTRVGLAEPPEQGADRVRVGLVVSPEGEAPGVVRVLARGREDGDLALAEAAERAAGGGGLGLLARRCEHVWIVDRGSGERLALKLAAILASTLLGPIVDPTSGEIFGVKTARAKLEALGTRGVS